MIWIFLLLVLVILFFLFQYGIILPSVKGLPVLLYHKFSVSEKDTLTVTAAEFENHLKFLREENYNSITAADLISYIDKKKSLPENPVLITIDDGFTSIIELAYPLLNKYNMRATIFLPTKFIGDESRWENDPKPILTVSQLASIDKEVFELALHSHSHINFKNISTDEIKNDLINNISFLEQNKIQFTFALAYPFGGRPKEKAALGLMKDLLSELKIKIAFRIGNRVNTLPVKDVYEIKRIDVQGTDSLRKFKTKLKKGRVKQL